jgi:hypothetical protein
MSRIEATVEVGRRLTEPVWQAAHGAGFSQYAPHDGRLASDEGAARGARARREARGAEGNGEGREE